jgi:hypothetical protein
MLLQRKRDHEQSGDGVQDYKQERHTPLHAWCCNTHLVV